MSESAEFYKRALPRGSQIVIERDGQDWIATLSAADRTVRWRGEDPELAVVALATAWMAQVCEDVTSERGK